MTTLQRQYVLITGNYWAFTLTDGALRMLVVLYFNALGYSPLEIALLFVFYEFFGVVTNLLGGWLGAHLGLNRTMNIGLGLQLLALAMLLVPTTLLTVPWVMAAQALSGIAKDLNKMSAKSAVKLLVPSGHQGRLFRWVALLTGSKNALKGLGFFLGGALLALWGFQGAVAAMLATLFAVWVASLILLTPGLGKMRSKPALSRLLAKRAEINALSAARFFLFGARDIWFVIAVPVHFATVFGWSSVQVGSFFALWVVGYGGVQTIAPRLTGHSALQGGTTVALWTGLLAVVACGIALTPGAASFVDTRSLLGWPLPELTLVCGLIVFGVLFAVVSSLHSYLIVSYADREGVALDVGFYYMANAMGRLFGTVASGWLYQTQSLQSCLIGSAIMLGGATALSLLLPKPLD
ncbi:MAG: organoarsenical effux MFS transporter ArsJ [Gammaproteobacteria bacterium]|nr:organoarsenical effux MFS transporter ArsJ [Gammaproteobacteria bacterium]